MREILFRGKRLDNDEWVKGSLLQSEIDGNKLFVKAQIHNRFSSDFSIMKHDVDPKTICEWTGLRDKNNNRIFEHHLVVQRWKS